MLLGLLIFALAAVAGTAWLQNHYQALHFADKERWSLEMQELRSTVAEQARQLDTKEARWATCDRERRSLEEENRVMRKELEDFANDLFQKLKDDRVIFR
jgi:SRSO17 transposase